MLVLILPVVALPVPNADFSGTPQEVCIYDIVYFEDMSTNDPTSWKWNFGDGGQSSEQSPSHVYTSPGLYTVSLKVLNAFGSDTEIKNNYINVSLCGMGIEYDMCGDMNLFFWNDSSSLGVNYNRLSTHPQLEDAKIMSATVSAATGEKTIGSFVTEPFPNGKVLGPGLTRYRTYLNVSSAVGITKYDFIPYNVSPTGVATRMFFGVPRTEEVNELAAREYLTSYARRNYTYFLPGERLLIRVNVSTTSVTERTAYFNIAGTSQASMVQVGYWICDDSMTCCNSDSGGGGEATGAAFGLIGGLMAAVICCHRRRKKNDEDDIL